MVRANKYLYKLGKSIKDMRNDVKSRSFLQEQQKQEKKMTIEKHHVIIFLIFAYVRGSKDNVVQKRYAEKGYAEKIYHDHLRY